MHIYIFAYIDMSDIYAYIDVCGYISMSRYGLATISRLLQIIGIFCRMSSLYRALWQKRPIILRSLLIVATAYLDMFECILIFDI